MKLLHIVPYAMHGGTEKDCYFFARDAIEYEHHIWVLGNIGPMSKCWQAISPFVEHLNLLDSPPRKFVELLQSKLSGHQFDGVLYWSTIRLPLVRFAVRGHTNKMAVHVGNPIMCNWKASFKKMLLSLIWNSNVEIKFFACSKYVENTLSNDSYLKQFERTTSLNPVELPKINPHQPKKLQMNDGVKLGMVARLYPIKDHETVIKAFDLILKKYPNARLQLSGEGILYNRLNDLVKILNLEGHVDFMGSVDDVYGFLNQLDVFLYGTTPREGLGNAVSEAMANGLPVVVSDLPMIREIACNEFSVMFCKPFDPKDMAEKAINLMKDYDKRVELSQNAYKCAQEAFNTKRYIDHRMEFFT